MQGTFIKWSFLIELIILIVSPIPFFEYYVKVKYFISDTQGYLLETNQFISDYFIVFMFARLFFLFRCLFDYSIYNDAYSKKICEQ